MDNTQTTEERVKTLHRLIGEYQAARQAVHEAWQAAWQAAGQAAREAWTAARDAWQGGWQALKDFVLSPHESDPELVRAIKEHWDAEDLQTLEAAVRSLLDAGADPNEGDPLSYACLLGRGDVARMMLDAGAEIYDHDYSIRVRIARLGEISAMVQAEVVKRGVKKARKVLRQRLESLQRRRKLVDFGVIDVVANLMTQ